jgi:DNA gyrase inhibitor GyrI
MINNYMEKNMNIENIPNCRLAFMRKIGKYGPENKNTMEKLKE